MAPQIRSPIKLKDEGLGAREWRMAQEMTTTCVKYTIPGPMTIMDGIIDNLYGDSKRRDLIDDIIKAINSELRALDKAGCKVRA